VNLKGAESMRCKIVERDALRVVGTEETDAGIPGISKLWGEVHENGTADLLIQLNNGQIKGLLSISAEYNETKNENY
jgi:AraC family transcriptional regulator